MVGAYYEHFELNANRDQAYDLLISGKKPDGSGLRCRKAQMHPTVCWTTGGTIKIQVGYYTASTDSYQARYYVRADWYDMAFLVLAWKDSASLESWVADRLRFDLTFKVEGDGFTAKIILCDCLNYRHDSFNPSMTTDDYAGYYIGCMPENLASTDDWHRYTQISIEPGAWLGDKKDHRKTSNQGKGHTYFNGVHQEKTREELLLPILAGAGKYNISIPDVNLMAIDRDKYYLFLAMKDDGTTFLTELHGFITVKSIITNDPAHGQALIAENPPDGEDPYNGQYGMGTVVHIRLGAPLLDPEWTAGGKKYAVVYVMLKGKNKDFIDVKHCRMWYSYLRTAEKPTNQAQMNEIYRNPRLLYNVGVRVDSYAENEYGGKFRFDDDYKYLFDEHWTRPDAVDITTEMPEQGDMALQFAALIFRVVDDDDSGGYKVDPACPSAIETHIGIYNADKLITNPKTIKVFTVGDVKNEIRWTLTPHAISNPLFVDITRGLGYAIGRDDGMTVGFKLLRINSDGSTTTIADDPTRYALGTSVTKQYEHVFHIKSAEHVIGAKYKVYAAVYDANGAPYVEHTFENELEVRPENVITNISIEPSSGSKQPKFKVPVFDMTGVTDPNAKYWYTLTAYSLPLTATPTVVDSDKYSETSFAPRVVEGWTTKEFTLPNKAKYAVIFEVWDKSNPALGTDVALASFSIEYEVEGSIENPQVDDTYNNADKRESSEYVKTQWSFQARAKGFNADTYKWQATLTDSSSSPQPKKTWDFAGITGDTLNFADTEIVNVAIGNYTFTITVMDAADTTMAATTTIENTIGGAKAEGTLANGDHSIRLSNPLDEPNDTTTEYRLMREGFTGAIESPWELKNESVVGSAAAGVTVWMVHPRTITLRVLVTAPKDDIVAATKELIGLLTVNPRSPISLTLWTSDGARQLTISGHPEVGTPVIEMRESTGAIVAITLNCPRYAWRSSRVTITAVQGGNKITVTPTGNLPPALDIWFSPTLEPNSDKLVPLTLTAKGVSKTITFNLSNAANIAAMHLHYDPILQDLTVQSEGNTKASSQQLATIPPRGTRGVRLVRDGDAVYNVEDAFSMVKPDSDLSALNIVPGVENTIEVSGMIDRLVLEPYYAHWW